jgi:penicillin-binding protein 1A
VRENLDAYATRHNLKPPYVLTSRPAWGKPFSGKPEPHRVVVGVVEATDDRLGTVDVRVGDLVGRVFLGQESRSNPGGLAPSEFTTQGALLRVSLAGAVEPGDKPLLRLELLPESALVALDVRTREVVALVGSYEGIQGGLDRAIHSLRQPGSAFKPFVYSYAIHTRRVTPATVLEVSASPRKATEPKTKRVSVRDAVARSDNAAAVRVLRDVGAASVVEWAHALGIESRLGADESLALGSYEVTPLEITNAFATFASGGERASPVLVTKLTGPGGTALPLPPKPPARPVMEADEAYLVTSLLKSVVAYGTGKRAQAVGHPVAGKTGTTNQAKDAWFVGYSTDLVVGVWVGYDDALPLGSSESGAVAALPAWVAFMKGAEADRPQSEFSRPPSIVTVRIDPESGLLPRDGDDSVIDEEFIDGTAPTEVAHPQDAGAPSPTKPASERRPKPDAGVPEEPPVF